jgi:hypothetical protein
MNLDNLQRKLIAAARAAQPSDQVPYAFEKRIMARLILPVQDAWATWGRALWRGAVFCIAIMICSGTWTFFSEDAADASGHDFAQEFESTLLVSAYSTTESSW